MNRNNDVVAAVGKSLIEALKNREPDDKSIRFGDDGRIYLTEQKLNDIISALRHGKPSPEQQRKNMILHALK